MIIYTELKLKCFFFRLYLYNNIRIIYTRYKYIDKQYIK